MIRHATWTRLEASPLWRHIYRPYRNLPEPLRVPIRVLLTPKWHLGSYLVRLAARRRVVGGPFRGMVLDLPLAWQRHLLSYFLGSQELELRPAIEAIIGRGYQTILNVGAAHGYYAVGLARLTPRSRVEAFEMRADLHPVLRRMAQLNGVSDRITVRGTCDLEQLDRSLSITSAPALVFMDIEGGELELLDPRAVPRLCFADVLVETHDSFIPGCTETLIDRFQSTHHIERFTARPRVPTDFPELFLPGFRRYFSRLAVELMDERRIGQQQWLYLTAKRAG
jgi:hypothetical protein